MAHLAPLVPALRMLIVLSALTGVAYPLVVTGIARLAFPHQANGSLIAADGDIVGSALVGQSFSDPKYFWSRPSATSPRPYDAMASSGSNLGPRNPVLAEAVRSRIGALRAADPGAEAPVPVDLVTASGSGLDPDISIAGAQYQLPRVAKARRLPEDRVRALVAAHTSGRTFGILGEPRVNVLRLNLALDHAAP